MKKVLIGIAIVFALAIILPTTASAQRCYKPKKTNYSNYNSNYNRNNYRASNNYRRYNNSYRRGNFYQRNRNIVNIGLGTGAGAIIGGIVGGKKGAVIGGLVGGGSSAIYTYKIRKNRRNYR
jgi:hypothetical protein